LRVKIYFRNTLINNKNLLKDLPTPKTKLKMINAGIETVASVLEKVVDKVEDYDTAAKNRDVVFGNSPVINIEKEDVSVDLQKKETVVVSVD
jgi:hypothetical protein